MRKAEEGDIGRFRRNHLTPVPTGDTLVDFNAFLDGYDTVDAQRWVTGRGPGAGDRVHALAALERPAMWVLPVERFDAVTRLTARVDTKARGCVRRCSLRPSQSASTVASLQHMPVVCIGGDRPGHAMAVQGGRLDAFAG